MAAADLGGGDALLHLEPGQDPLEAVASLRGPFSKLAPVRRD